MYTMDANRRYCITYMIGTTGYARGGGPGRRDPLGACTPGWQGRQSPNTPLHPQAAGLNF